jgi:hypothetical protein
MLNRGLGSKEVLKNEYSSSKILIDASIGSNHGSS